MQVRSSCDVIYTHLNIAGFTDELYAYVFPDFRSWTKDGYLPYVRINDTAHGKLDVDGLIQEIVLLN